MSAVAARRTSPVRVPAVSAGKGRKKSDSGKTTPRSPRDAKTAPGSGTRKMSALSSSTAAPSEPAEQARRQSHLMTRPSFAGLVMANRIGMGMLRKLRASQGSKRGSTIGDKPEVPVQNLEPTYRLDPKVTFQPKKVQEVLQKVLDGKLTGRAYKPRIATMLCRAMSDEIREEMKNMGFDRYRAVVTVMLGEMKNQGVTAASRCSWDDKRDNFATYTFRNTELYCTATCYGVYKE